MQNLITNLKALGRNRLLVLGGMTAGVFLALLFGLSAVTAPDHVPLYRNLSPAGAMSVEARLNGAGFDARVSEDGTGVTVPRSDLARARMVVAESGPPVEGDPGWELFDANSGLAMNTFMQRVNRLRAMEGELARSIQTLDGVRSARVHLVLPEREAFSREKAMPRASVIVRPAAGRMLARKQAVAIRNLVASAVSELELGRVTVLSASGEVILAEMNDSNGQATMQSNKSAIEERLSQEVSNILTARVGAGNARVRVNVDLNTAREVVVQQSFDPDQQVVRSTENRNEEKADSRSGGNVGVENNIPAALAGPEAGATPGSSSQTKTGELVTYEIGNTRREIVREAGEVERISVAVLVNGLFTVEDNEVVYSDRQPEELQRLADLVKTAVGFDEARGDEVSVDSLRFMDFSMEVGEPVQPTLAQQLQSNMVTILRGLFGLIVVALVMILGVRPALRFLTEKPALPPAPPQESEAIAAPAGTNDSLPAASGADPQQIAGNAQRTVDAPGVTSIFDPSLDGGAHEYIETMGVRGSLIKARVDAIQEMAEEKPEEVLRVLRSWLKAEADA